VYRIKKATPVRRWLFDIFKFPNVEVGRLEEGLTSRLAERVKDKN